MTSEQKDEQLFSVVEDLRAQVSEWRDSAQAQLDRLSDKYWEQRYSREDRFWITVWTLLAASICTITLICSIFSSIRESNITEMVKAGADPIAARCAFSSNSDMQLCTTQLMASKISDLNNSK